MLHLYACLHVERQCFVSKAKVMYIIPAQYKTYVVLLYLFLYVCVCMYVERDKDTEIDKCADTYIYFRHMCMWQAPMCIIVPRVFGAPALCFKQFSYLPLRRLFRFPAPAWRFLISLGTMFRFQCPVVMCRTLLDTCLASRSCILVHPRSLIHWHDVIHSPAQCFILFCWQSFAGVANSQIGGSKITCHKIQYIVNIL